MEHSEATKQLRKRMDTSLASEGAEFLVLGNLLIRSIEAYKAYTNTEGYDLIAYNRKHGSSASIIVSAITINYRMLDVSP